MLGLYLDKWWRVNTRSITMVVVFTIAVVLLDLYCGWCMPSKHGALTYAVLILAHRLWCWPSIRTAMPLIRPTWQVWLRLCQYPETVPTSTVIVIERDETTVAQTRFELTDWVKKTICFISAAQHTEILAGRLAGDNYVLSSSLLSSALWLWSSRHGTRPLLSNSSILISSGLGFFLTDRFCDPVSGVLTCKKMTKYWDCVKIT